MMKKRIGILVVGLSAAAMLPATASAEERSCRGEIGRQTVDNLRVPDGASCVLRGTVVKGTVKVERNARLEAINVRVIGNVQGENARRVAVIRGSRIGGSVQVVQGGSAEVAGSRVEQDILYDSNVATVVAKRNRVVGNIQAFQNKGGVTIAENRINGNLQCKENSPRPVGGGNIVGGNKEDQCARL